MTAIFSERRGESGKGALALAQQGDHDAFAALVSEHEAMVWSIAWSFFRDRGRAEEIAQDVFLQLYRKLGEITSPAHLLFWLRQVTARRCIDQTRKSRLRAVSLEDVQLDLSSAAPNPDPLRDRLLRELVAGLPEAQRVVVTLRYQEDLDPLEICRIVDMPVNTVKSHLHRALQALRKKLGEHV